MLSPCLGGHELVDAREHPAIDLFGVCTTSCVDVGEAFGDKRAQRLQVRLFGARFSVPRSEQHLDGFTFGGEGAGTDRFPQAGQQMRGQIDGQPFGFAPYSARYDRLPPELLAPNLLAYNKVPIYKAAPRDGVWATPPFLHNGSVPNLYEMLIPAAERTKKFYLGGDFDPVKVGVDTTATSGTFLMDTTLLGNSNAGHSFQNGPRGEGIVGPLLTDDQRQALVEYLKSIPEEPGRITPFGGFPEGRLPHP